MLLKVQEMTPKRFDEVKKNRLLLMYCSITRTILRHRSQKIWAGTSIQLNTVCEGSYKIMLLSIQDPGTMVHGK